MSNGININVWRPIAGSGQNLAIGASSVASNAVGASTYAVQLSALGNCHVRIAHPSTPLVSPVQSAAVPSTTGGTLAAGTYYYEISALNSAGETLPSNEVSATTTGTTSSVVLSWGAVPGATGYRVYRGTSAGGENVYYAPGNVLTYTDTNAADTAGTPSATNTTAIVPAAVATDMLIKASDGPLQVACSPGDKVAVIQDATATGNLNICELTH